MIFAVGTVLVGSVPYFAGYSSPIETLFVQVIYLVLLAGIESIRAWMRFRREEREIEEGSWIFDVGSDRDAYRHGRH